MKISIMNILRTTTICECSIPKDPMKISLFIYVNDKDLFPSVVPCRVCQGCMGVVGVEAKKRKKEE